MGEGETLDELERELGRHPSLSAAIKSAEDAGKSPQYIASLRLAAARKMQLEEPRMPAPQSMPDPVVARGTPSRHVELRPRKGCSCRKHYDPYLDNDFGALARVFGGGIGIGTFIMIRIFGLLGALAIACGLAGTGGFVTIFSICFRCEGCRNRIYDLDVDERAHLAKGRGMVILVTAGFFAGAAICGYLWWRLATAQLQ